MSREFTLTKLSAADRHLVETARDLSANAYAPYSGFAVGAAVRTRTGNIYPGANLENASYAVVTCAEVSAVAAANAAGDYEIEAIAIVGHKFGPPEDTSQIVTPCGRCRQVIAEAAAISGIDVIVFACSGDLTRIVGFTISELLPAAFGSENLGLTETWPAMRLALRTQVAKLRSLTKRKVDSAA